MVQQSQTEQIDVQPEDIEVLCKQNVLAAQQLRNIVLSRLLAEKDAEIAKLIASNGKAGTIKES